MIFQLNFRSRHKSENESREIQASAQSKENVDIQEVLDVQKIFAVYVAVETKREVVTAHHEMRMGIQLVSDNSRYLQISTSEMRRQEMSANQNLSLKPKHQLSNSLIILGQHY